MPVLRGAELERTVGLLKRRGARLYHACQLRDFKSYLKLGGVPSRRRMEDAGVPYTVFVTDEQDRLSGVWPLVFVNLQDFGHGFAVGRWSDDKAPTPNPYGPILIQMRPEALLEAQDVAVCLRSAGGRGFSRESEALGTAADVDRVFKHPADSKRPKSTYVRWSDELRHEFAELMPADGSATGKTLSPEVSCSVQAGVLPFSYADAVTIDRYELDGIWLIKEAAKAVAAEGPLACDIALRGYASGREQVLLDIVAAWRRSACSLRELQGDSVSEETRDWAGRVSRCGLDWQFDRFIYYLGDGTLRQLLEE